MEQLTPLQRLEAYEYALSTAKEFNQNVCIALSVWLHEKEYNVMPSGVGEYFPEFIKMKPDPLPFAKTTNWWSNDKDGQPFRIAALEECIKECQLLINQSQQ